MPRYEVMRDEDGYYVVDTSKRHTDLERYVARFNGTDSQKNAEAFCFMKNMWQTSG